MTTGNFRVLLVNCNTPMDNLIPAGISVISAMLKREGFPVRLFDTTFYKPAGYLTGDEARTLTLQVKKTDLEEVGIHPKPGPITEEPLLASKPPSGSRLRPRSIEWR